MYHTLVWDHSICTRRRDYSHSGHDTRLCPDFKLSRTTSVEICGRGGLTVTRLTANGGALLNSVMCRVSKVPDIIFLQVGGNDFPRTAWNQRDADAFLCSFWSEPHCSTTGTRQRGLLWVAFCSAFQLEDPGEAFLR